MVSESDWRPEVANTLRALDEATLGDLVAVTGLFRWEVVAALEALIADEQAHVRVSDSGDVVYRVYRVDRRRSWSGGVAWPRRRSPRSSEVAFDRKTLRLIRKLEGVLSMVELVEHTGLPLAEAEVEMARLAACYGGTAHPSLDGHVVWAFPELMRSSQGRFEVREPRPAWVRSEDPMERARAGRRGWLRRAVRTVLEHPRLRFRNRRALRRYALGYVIQAALAGKGIVSLRRTVAYLRARAGKRRVSAPAVEAALRTLACEFDASLTEVGDELFFGFRNVKRQFLASHLVRGRMRLSRTASGRTVFDTADTPRMAGERDLESFDLELLSPRLLPHEKHDGGGLTD